MPYQDVLIDGQVTEKGDRECAARYGAIKPHFSRYGRRFCLLDIGAAEGYFGFRIAQDFDAVVVMVDYLPRLAELCERNKPRRTIFLHHGLSVKDLVDLGDCEHFDVTLALSVIHHWGNQWKEAAEAILDIGQDVFVETLAPEDQRACYHQYAVPLFEHLRSLETCKGLYGAFRSHTSEESRPMWRFGINKHTLRRAFLTPPDRAGICDMNIFSGFQEKGITHKGVTRSWIHGINLWTYHNWAGERGYPPRSYVVQKLKEFPLPTARHGDIRPWNFIFDGEDLFLIDGNDERANFNDKEGLEETIAILEKAT